uniref:Uncharacterized protein n=1 Tax=Tanacetum cinerariifolium TaxID=118510 RepID=A0A6L2NA38_TANCI|nr:hypothetical protein [Tanacetum cinerariifolium]
MVVRVSTSGYDFPGIWRAVVEVAKHEGVIMDAFAIILKEKLYMKASKKPTAVKVTYILHMKENMKALKNLLLLNWLHLVQNVSSLAAVSIWYKSWLDLRLIRFGTKGGSARSLHLRVSVVCESVPAKTVVFLEEMMNKESSRECQLADLVNEGREMVREIEFFVGKLMRDARRMSSRLQRKFRNRQLSGQLRNGMRMRDIYIRELRTSAMSDEVLESIEILKRVQLDDMKKASRFLLMAREIQSKVFEKNTFIARLLEV